MLFIDWLSVLGAADTAWIENAQNLSQAMKGV